jgi:AraC family transcriptional regulator
MSQLKPYPVADSTVGGAASANDESTPVGAEPQRKPVCALLPFAAGSMRLSPLAYSILLMHLSSPVAVVCRRGGNIYSGTEVYGDADFVPSGMASQWEVNAPGTSLLVRIPDSLFAQACHDFGADFNDLRLKSHFQLRDPQIHCLAGALKIELESGSSQGILFQESLVLALASILMGKYQLHAQRVATFRSHRGHTRKIVEFIEGNLSAELRLSDIATATSLSVSHLKAVFRYAMGEPIHQYVLRRRIETAESLLLRTDLPISEVALASGFSHQSHLTRHLRRSRGTTPFALRRHVLISPP